VQVQLDAVRIQERSKDAAALAAGARRTAGRHIVRPWRPRHIDGRACLTAPSTTNPVTNAPCKFTHRIIDNPAAHEPGPVRCALELPKPADPEDRKEVRHKCGRASSGATMPGGDQDNPVASTASARHGQMAMQQREHGARMPPPSRTARFQPSRLPAVA